ncbi:hypothetical protein BN000_01192 [Mycobacterium europaeum]|uniref:Uncharacterized protein n=1 Tax=Mycobacterium europaeum TaxID=761804 RepID=A0A0U1D0X0_9MYCO|nr:hypothetical protein BN000_01192 [Mycobacterium europaeum]
MLLVFLMLMMRRHDLGGGKLHKIDGTAETICGAVWVGGSPEV